MRLIRGKSWMELGVENLDAMHSRMEPQAFLYYLPGMLHLAIANPDEIDVSDRVCAEFVVPDIGDPSRKLDSIASIVAGLTDSQRNALLAFFDWMRSLDWTANLLIDAACETIISGRATPFSASALDESGSSPPSSR